MLPCKSVIDTAHITYFQPSKALLSLKIHTSLPLLLSEHSLINYGASDSVLHTTAGLPALGAESRILPHCACGL